MRRVALFALLALGCSDPNDIDPSSGVPDAGTTPKADGAAPPAPVRFVALGDTGKGNDGQYAVANAIEAKCEADGCDFVVLLGDNIYNNGVSSVDDPQWQEKFEQPYANIDLPFHVVLGNHDYNGNGLASDWGQGPIEVQYSEKSTKWSLPDTHYTFRAGNVGFIMLDTNSLFWDNTENGDQKTWYSQALSEVDGSEWVIVAGHHPYLSNGAHGNAGDYDNATVDGVEVPNPISPANGAHVKSFFDDVVCGTGDLYLAGHDHDRQWLNEPSKLCGMEMIVSGAGASTREKDFDRNQERFENYDTEGFLYVVVDGGTLTAQFIDKNGTLDFAYQLEK